MRKSIRRSRFSGRRGAVIVEFALVIPFLALIVFGVIDFSRAYGQMNALDSALREGARYGSKWRDWAAGDYTTAVKTKVQGYATIYGFNGLDLTKVSVAVAYVGTQPIPETITVTVTAHPIPLPILSRFMFVPPLTLTRTITYRTECAGLVPSTCVNAP